jgi:hypothetical protein
MHKTLFRNALLTEKKTNRPYIASRRQRAEKPSLIERSDRKVQGLWLNIKAR